MNTLDLFSFQCGVIDCFCEMVHSGVKSLALSHPAETREQRDAFLPFAHDACVKYGVRLYPEDDPLLTDLFPLSMNQGKFNILFYRADHVIEEYIRLKQRKTALVAGRAYFGGNRTQIATSYGRLLSYTDEAIRRLIQENAEKEQI